MLIGVLSFSVTLADPAVARAQSSASVDAAAPSSFELDASSAQGSDGGAQLQWRWRRFSPAQYALTGTLLAGTLALGFSSPDLGYSWSGGLLFDERARDTLRARRGGAVADKISDALLYGLTLYPFLVDSGLLAWGVRKSPDVAWQMFAINSQAFLLNGLVTQLTKLLTRRHRPKTQECDPSDPSCMHEPASFFSGHTSMAFTGAGLVCAHATSMPGLYGSARAGQAACFSALTAATAVGTLRIVGDEHYATDVIVGAAVGLLIGYFVPKWMHYDREVAPVAQGGGRALAGDGELDRYRSESPPVRQVVAPLAGRGAIGLSYQLTW